jgi:hypothetical protein
MMGVHQARTAETAAVLGDPRGLFSGTRLREDDCCFRVEFRAIPEIATYAALEANF